MRIFSKRAFKFDHPAGQEPAVIVKSHSFADVPGWVAKSAMFQLASSAGEVSIIETKQDEKSAEAKATKGRGGRQKADDEDKKADGEENAPDVPAAETE